MYNTHCIFCDKPFCKHNPAEYKDGSKDYNFNYKSKRYIILIQDNNLTIIAKKKKIKTLCKIEISGEINKNIVERIIDNLVFC